MYINIYIYILKIYCVNAFLLVLENVIKLFVWTPLTERERRKGRDSWRMD